ncbi:MAG: hypothetical protein Phyf2KO_01990 [Phycisphaerales bacterium]
MSKSLMDGIEFGEKRKAVDADWSKARKLTVGSIASLLALGAIGAGAYFMWQNRPVSLPKSADEAIAVINSGRIERLPVDRQRQYYAEASRLMEDIPWEERREYFREEDNRDAMREVMMAQMDNTMREIARGNLTIEDWRTQMGRFRNRPRPEGRQGENGGRPDGERPRGPEGEEGERPSRAERQQAMTNRMEGMFQNGDGQRMGLMMAFRQKMGGWGRPGGGGGGNRNGGN